jgi:hypothetical protein
MSQSESFKTEGNKKEHEHIAKLEKYIAELEKRITKLEEHVRNLRIDQIRDADTNGMSRELASEIIDREDEEPVPPK